MAEPDRMNSESSGLLVYLNRNSAGLKEFIPPDGHPGKIPGYGNLRITTDFSILSELPTRSNQARMKSSKKILLGWENL